jgi:hypothetical protein
MLFETSCLNARGEQDDEVKFMVGLFLTLSHILFFGQPGAGRLTFATIKKPLHRSRYVAHDR